MAEIKELKKCAHPACNCLAPEGESYCSSYCHDMRQLTEIACKCIHPGCTEEMAHEG